MLDQVGQVYPVTFAPDCGCNTPDEILLEQIARNIRLGLPQAMPHEPNMRAKLLLVCGGPSLEDTRAELVDEYFAGGKIVAVNGAYEWCLQNNLKPSAVVMIDAREFNSRFVERPVIGCKYLLASQCHPRAFELCRGRETYIWHALGSGSDAELEILKAYYFGRLYPATLGTTIGVRAISLMRMLGWFHQEIFGLDSCWLDDRHHGYAQEENDADGRLRVYLRARDAAGNFDEARTATFWCAPWHMKQVDDFQTLIKERGNLFRLNVHGPGLIATMMRTGAAMQVDDDQGKG